jgi:hypothetical protein
MIKNFETVRAQLKELSDVINSYKTEAVQLRLVELIFGSSASSVSNGDQPDPPATLPPLPAKKRRKTRATRNGGGAGDANERTNRSSSRLGGAATLAALLAEGFFKKPRTISGMVAHCETNRASKFKQSEFSGSLARYVREKKLTRAKNGDGQYEYSQP